MSSCKPLKPQGLEFDLQTMETDALRLVALVKAAGLRSTAPRCRLTLVGPDFLRDVIAGTSPLLHVSNGYPVLILVLGPFEPVDYYLASAALSSAIGEHSCAVGAFVSDELWIGADSHEVSLQVARVLAESQHSQSVVVTSPEQVAVASQSLHSPLDSLGT